MLNSYTLEDLLKNADQKIIEKKASKNNTILSDETTKIAEKLLEAADELESNKTKSASSIENTDISFNEKIAQAINLVNVIQEIENIKPFINFVKEAQSNGYTEEEAIKFYNENNK